MGTRQMVKGIVFSDLGEASKFMGLDWVQEVLTNCLGFAPFPATLNIRPAGAEDAAAWQSVQNDARFFFPMPSHGGSCTARIYPVKIHAPHGADGVAPGAVLYPEIRDYPSDKIEIVAPTRLKDTFGVKDGDQLTLEFVH